MRLNILSDAHWESRVGKVIDDLSSTGYRSAFELRDYGKGLKAITVVFICQDPKLNLKPRISLLKNERKLYLDIMLDLKEMRLLAADVRKRIVIDRLSDELPAVLRKYTIQDFVESRFTTDLKSWLESIR